MFSVQLRLRLEIGGRIKPTAPVKRWGWFEKESVSNREIFERWSKHKPAKCGRNLRVIEEGPNATSSSSSCPVRLLAFIPCTFSYNIRGHSDLLFECIDQNPFRRG
jgi:hypothetical protein